MVDNATPAQLEFDHGQFRIVWPGSYVICAITGVRIPIEELRYWSVDRQQAYASAEVALSVAYPAQA